MLSTLQIKGTYRKITTFSAAIVDQVQCSEFTLGFIREINMILLSRSAQAVRKMSSTQKKIKQPHTDIGKNVLELEKERAILFKTTL